MRFRLLNIILLYLFFWSTVTLAQNGSIKGVVTTKSAPVLGAMISLNTNLYFTVTDSDGKFEIKEIKPGSYTLLVSCVGCKSDNKSIVVEAGKISIINIELDSMQVQLNTVEIIADEKNNFGVNHLKNIEDYGIYAGKKSEVVLMDNVIGNTATNNSRQIFSKVSGINIFENDGAGIQLGIGGRGMNPNRIANFNTRQNGYDMSADALGYPDSYYTPPAEALEKIEIVRGASSLQYGPQFGGFINFKLKKGNATKPIEVVSRNTLGSFGLYNSFNSVGGTTCKNKINYYTFFQHKQGKGWRPNSSFNVKVAHTAVAYKPNKKLEINTEYTYMYYIAQQAGGLTDAMFEKNPQQSVRSRNWFKVNWNLAAVTANYILSEKIKFNTRFFGLAASRHALGILNNINRPDVMNKRDLWIDEYNNWGNETRMLYNYIIKNNPSVLLVGTRYYKGTTDRKQGFGNSSSSGNSQDFLFQNESNTDFSSYKFPSNNVAFFAENIFQFSPKLNITPGVRFENINTNANGYYNDIAEDLAGNIIFKETLYENITRKRSFILGGIGLSYKPYSFIELYGNFSQNYRAIGFSDMRVTNPNVRVDKNLQDETGYTADIGFRGTWKNILSYDVTGFYLKYNNRIGSILKSDENTFNTYRLRTNISDSRNAGIEALAEADIWRWIFGEKKSQVLIFANFSWVSAKYINSSDAAVEGNKVEMVPEFIYRTGVTWKRKKWGISYQYSYTSKQFTEATNALFTYDAVNGIIPSYYVMDLSAQYTWKFITASSGINNLTDNRYFTRRADGYPGPGIIPSDARNFYLSLQVTF